MAELESSVAIIGAVHVDDIAIPQHVLIPNASNPVQWERSCGGVAANVARTTSQFLPSVLIAAVGDDNLSVQLEKALRSETLYPCFEKLPNVNTGRYTAVLDHQGNLHIGLAAVEQAEKLSWSHIVECLEQQSLSAVVFDTNLTEQCIEALCQRCRSTTPPLKLIAVAVSPSKVTRIAKQAGVIDLLFCNRDEACALTNKPANTAINNLADELIKLGFKRFVLSDGASPLIAYEAPGTQLLQPAAVAVKGNVNGAGDAMAAATLSHWLLDLSLTDALQHHGIPAAANVLSGRITSPRLNTNG